MRVTILRDRIEGTFYVKLGLHRSEATEFCLVASNIFGPSVYNLRRVTPLASRIMKWLVDC
jgi:hypothetical protein